MSVAKGFREVLSALNTRFNSFSFGFFLGALFGSLMMLDGAGLLR